MPDLHQIDPIHTPFKLEQIVAAAAALKLHVHPSDYMIAPRQSIDLQPNVSPGLHYSTYYDMFEYLIFLALIEALESRHSEFEVAEFARSICDEFARAIDAETPIHIDRFLLHTNAPSVVVLYLCISTVLRVIERALKVRLPITIEAPQMPLSLHPENSIQYSNAQRTETRESFRILEELVASGDPEFSPFCATLPR